MDVSENRGTPKSSTLIGFSIIFTMHLGIFPIFGNAHIDIIWYIDVVIAIIGILLSDSGTDSHGCKIAKGSCEASTTTHFRLLAASVWIKILSEGRKSYHTPLFLIKHAVD